ncbi:MAG: lipoate--protein ligase family protein [Cyanobacteria bacterium]|nr:lipoate--protein ligase family protein [Cyanobacteriota bacterium]
MDHSPASPLPVMRLLPSSCHQGARQMAIDNLLLEQRAPAFRLYSWRHPTLSLGFHQRCIEPHWQELAAKGIIDLVRRPSGGRAVLHAGELTYALIWPDPNLSRLQTYGHACSWLVSCFATLGLPLQAGRQAASPQPSSCFATSTAADLVHASGVKRVGSAQLWRRDCLLQHGSILLEPPADLWRLVFRCPPPQLPALPVSPAELELRLIEAAKAELPVAAGGNKTIPLIGEEWERITATEASYLLELA